MRYSFGIDKQSGLSSSLGETNENHPGKRAYGQFGLAAVYHVGNGKLEKVWVNPDPTSDQGEALIAVR